MKYSMINLFLFLFTVICSNDNFAQSTRSLVNEGVDLYNEQNYADAEVNFKKGAEESPNNFEAKFNLGDAYYKQQRYDEAMKAYQSAFVDAKNDLEKSDIYYNIGNSLLKSQKLKESIAAYKEALKLDPNDEQAKYNLSYALNQLNNQDQNQDQNQQQNDENKDENKDQQQQDQQNEDQQNKDQQNQDQQQQDQQNQDQQEQQQSQEQKEQELTKQEAEKILNALKENEKDLQKKLRKVKGQPVKTEKDW